MLDVGSQSFETFRAGLVFPGPRQPAAAPRARTPERTTSNRVPATLPPASGVRGRANLLLFGAPGLGKTFLSACIARVVSEDGYLRCVYDTAAHMCLSLLEEREVPPRATTARPPGRTSARWMQCDLLIIDDLGTEMNSTFVQSALYQLINGRLLGMKSTIISTNLTPEDIGRRYSQQVYSRIEGEYQLLPFVGTDIRRLKRERG